MEQLKEKIMHWNFGQIARRFALVAVLYVVLGGIISGILLMPQIQEIIALENAETTADTEMMTTEDNAMGALPNGGMNAEGTQNGATYTENGRGHQHGDFQNGEFDGRHSKAGRHNDWEDQITMPGIGTCIVLGMLGIFGAVLALIYWFLIVAWLYKNAVLENMNRSLWTIFGIFGNLIAVAAFLIVRDRPTRLFKGSAAETDETAETVEAAEA